MMKDTNARKIDVHHHILPPFYADELRQRGLVDESNWLPEWSPEASLEFMDEAGIETAVVSVSTPGVYFDDPKSSRDLARRCNEYSAKLVSDYPGRFRAVASLPLPELEGALEELEYSMDTLGLDGVVLMSNSSGRYLGEPESEDLFRELNRRGLPVFIHPNAPPQREHAVSEFVEYTHEVARAVTELIYAGFIKRYKRIKFILAHAGGSTPFLSIRLITVGLVDSTVGESPIKFLIPALLRLGITKRFYYDMASMSDPHSLSALIPQFKASHLLLGTNYPWTPPAAIHRQMRDLSSYEGLTYQALKSVERTSAAGIFRKIGNT